MIEFGRSTHKTQAEAWERARKVAFFLGVIPNLFGSDEAGHIVCPDSPLVPGFTGENPYKR